MQPKEINTGFNTGYRLSHPMPGDEVVIAGIGGRYPESDNIYEFQENLFNKVDLVTENDRRWISDDPEVPRRTGKIKHINKFDADFFNISDEEADFMDPISRIIMETAYEAVVDAGVNPRQLRGRNIGVFIGASFSDSEYACIYRNKQNGYGILGCSRAMMANRISSWFGITGPSYSVDSACSSSLYALEQAYKSIRDGQCEAALVGAGHLILNSLVTLQFAKLGILSKDGICKCFDAKANGYVRSETISIIYLQKKKNAKRMYAKIVHSKTNCDGYKSEGITYPSEHQQVSLLKECYEECGVSPKSLFYVESHGTGTSAGDIVEINALDSFFCSNRSGPLKIGSVKSNMGHSEASAGMSSIAKDCIAFETGFYPPNLHFDKPAANGPIDQGRLEVVLEKTPLAGNLIAVNSFGFGGSNAHLLLERNLKVKSNANTCKTPSIPQIVVASGRTEESVNKIFDDVLSHQCNAEFIRLINDVHQDDIPGHLYRGYAIFVKSKGDMPKCVYLDVKLVPQSKTPIWFVFTETQSVDPVSIRQWMMIPAFSAVIERCHRVLKPKGVHVADIIDSVDKISLVNNHIRMVAIQLALIDTLRVVGITPDFIIGDTNHELCCAYADGCLTLEHTILAAYHIALARTKSKFCLEYDLVSIQSQLKKNLNVVIPKTIKRSDKWISINAAQNSDLNDEHSCLINYFTDNFMRYITMDQINKVIPSNVIRIDIIPQDKMQIHTHKSTKNNTKESLNQKTFIDHTEDFMSLFGRLYLDGYTLNLAKLYPDVEFPVSRGTPMISPIVKWDHSKDRYVWPGILETDHDTGVRKVSINLMNENEQYLIGHTLDGRNIFPATGYLVLVWETIALLKERSYQNVSIVFDDVHFVRATNIPKEGNLDFVVTVQRGTGNFEISENGATVASGRAYIPHDITREQIDFDISSIEVRDNLLPLKTEDIYKEFRLRGYNYSGSFCGIKTYSNKGNICEIEWKNNWVCFLDNMMQMDIIKQDYRELFIPTGFQRLSINCDEHYRLISKSKENTTFTFYKQNVLHLIKSPAVEMRDLTLTAVGRRKPHADPVLETHRFVPYRCFVEMTIENALRINIDLALENVPSFKVKIIELIKSSTVKPLAIDIAQTFKDIALAEAEIVILSDCDVIINDPGHDIVVSHESLENVADCFIVVGQKMLEDEEVLLQAVQALKQNGFLLSRENFSTNIKVPKDMELIAHQATKNEHLFLLKKKTAPQPMTAIHISNEDMDFQWIEQVKDAMNSNNKIVVYAELETQNGIMGFVNCLRKETGGENVQCVFVLDKSAPRFNTADAFYKNQLQINLAMNIFKNGQWGSYRHLLMEKENLVQSEHSYVNFSTRGDLSSLQWVQGPLKSSNVKETNKLLVKPYYSSLNFRDVMMATNKLTIQAAGLNRIQQNSNIGFEFSGITTSGRRVMGFYKPPLISTLILVDNYFLWNIPDSWTLQEAATIPLVYYTVLYSLVTIGGIKKGMDVLIHSGSGAIGQAAIIVALHYGCTVYTTVGTKEKINFIRKQFPQIKDSQIGNSRDTSFEQLVMTETKGRGVDLVLNSLSDDKLKASVRCLAPKGRFLEIGKYDMMNNTKLNLGSFINESSYHGIMVDSFFTDTKTETKQALHNLLAGAINSGIVRPLPYTIYNNNQVEDAFRYMAAGKHIGKVLIEVRKESEAQTNFLTTSIIHSKPKFYCDPNMTYVLCGGLGGFGLELVDWLVLRGARKLVLTSRQGISTGYQNYRVQLWREYGCTIKISTTDCTKLKDCEEFLQDAESIGPVAGIFNLAAVLRDAIFENQTIDKYRDSLAPKVLVCRNLDVASRKYCLKLKHFVMFSSISCGRGNAGQTNYGMANSVMERICESRVLEGLPGLAIQWGAIGEVGLIANMHSSKTDIEIGGTVAQSISSCMEAMDRFLTSSEPVVASMVLAEKRTQKSANKFNVIEHVADLIGVHKVESISAQITLPELGMDSMMAVELKQSLERDFDIFLSAKEIRELTFEKLRNFVNEDKNSVEDNKPKDSTKLKQNNSLQSYISMERFGTQSEASQPIVRLPSLAGATNIINEAESSIFLIPGMEGVSTSLKSLASALNQQALCLQLAYQSSYKSITEIANELLPHIKTRVKQNSPFHIVGYSFGTAVALEIVMMLERDGYQGSLCLIDGAPIIMKKITSSLLGDQEVQLNLLLQLREMTELTHIKDFKEKLSNLPTWEEKVELCLKSLRSNLEHSKELMELIYNSCYYRLKAYKDYDYKGKALRSHVILIRPTVAMVPNLEEDYGLSKLTQNPVPVHFIEGNHVSIVESAKCADIINKLFT